MTFWLRNLCNFRSYFIFSVNYVNRQKLKMSDDQLPVLVRRKNVEIEISSECECNNNKTVVDILIIFFIFIISYYSYYYYVSIHL